ncbi:MAG: sensor histidine kinase KdpD [Planctomycetaceae bacterium]|nr:sensor histidine kinase KdpD [Planctomycetaceae bacterium]
MSHQERPSPEQMLARIRSDASAPVTTTAGGQLRLFFGYAAGVGKTYAMLQAAQTLKRDGHDVVIGYVEPHERPETQALTEGLESIPCQKILYRGSTLKEFDLDATLARKPEYVLVDELAHSNASGCRHLKRWQDVEELLAAGIHVFTTLNVQHIESLNDVVSEISGVHVRETVPDAILQRADEITLIDVSPDELLERLRQGKVYVPQQAAFALERFFRKNNLVALREMALRRAADHVHDDVEVARLGSAANRPWPTNERLLVCVGPSPTSARVVRAAKRLADRLHAPWIALHIESSHSSQWTEEARNQLHRNLKLAESLGGEVVQVSGEDIAQELLAYASSRNVTKLVVGKTGETQQRWWRNRQSLVDRLLRNSENMDVIVVRGVEEPRATQSLWNSYHDRPSVFRWIEAGLALSVATTLALAMNVAGFSEANLVMVYLLSVIVIAARSGTTPSIVASTAAVLVFDIFFTEPYYRITVYDSQYLITFAVMLVVGLLASTLTSRIHRQAETARKNERRAESLYRLSRRLVRSSKTTELLTEAEKIVSEVFDAHAVIYLPNQNRQVRPVFGHVASFAASAKEFATAQWVLDNNEPAGAGTNTLPSTEALYLPLSTPDNVAGVMAVQPSNPKQPLSFDARQLLETYATQIAFAIERINLAERSQKAELEFETEKLRSSLLSAVSHDLRTPLAAIAGAASSLDANINHKLLDGLNHELLETIVDESQRLTRLVENLLNMTRLSSGKVHLNRQWQPVEEVIGSALTRLEHILGDRDVKVHIAGYLPLIHGDELLLETVLVNLIDNALKYSSSQTSIEIEAHPIKDGIAIQVADRGCGIVAGDEQKIFEMFQRGSGTNTDRRGTGLGLAICDAIVRAHKGTITAIRRPEGGTIVRFTIPNETEPPVIHSELNE